MKHSCIVITGISCLCGISTDTPAIWDSMRTGSSTIRTLTNGHLHDLKIRIGVSPSSFPSTVSSASSSFR